MVIKIAHIPKERENDMAHNDLTFFTNEPERNLYDRFNSILKSNTQFFDILVGYFRTSGFFLLYPAMDDIEKIRILVGLNVDAKTVEIINQANVEITLESFSHKEAKQMFANAIENEFSVSDDSFDVEQGVKTLIEWIKNGKIEMRMYPEASIHAKVYIMRKDMDKVPDQYGSVITGSSNFSMAGLKNNLEFNVELKDSRDVEFALNKFEELWKQSVEISDIYVDTIKEKTWLKDDVTPYELYIKTLYEFFKEEINQDREALLNELIPDGYMRLQYQIDAVTQAKKILEAYGGVFIADVVGLGKTYICAMLAKTLKNKRKLIICPPVLVDYWDRVMKEFDVVADVVSLGKLDRILEDEATLNQYQYVFIDEAHRFRNQDTEAFKLLHEICYNKKVILISATPINNYSSDIENQIYLFQPKHNSTIMPNTKNLAGFFSRLNRSIKKLEKGSPEYYAQLKRNSESIRDNLLRHIMVRRTRKEIMEFYADDLNKQGLKFPTLGIPKKVVYIFDKDIDEVFKETMHLIRSLDYARYSPLLYLNDNKKYASMMVAQRNMSGFMKSILVKRLESSFYAFKMTLGRFIDSYQKFIIMCKAGDVYISKKVNVYDLLDSGDDSTLMELVDGDKVQHFKLEEFSSSFIPSLERDLAMLQRLKEHWTEITVDPKLAQFKKELKTNKVLSDNKIIIFTESKETAGYLGDALAETYGDRVVVFSGESSEYLKRDIERSYNPLYKDAGQDKYNILITTDVLAEGVNLHRSNVVINYDLPWNPTKIMQRVGRINRVGTEHDKIYVFNFFPTSQTDAQLPLKDRIIEKIQAFHDTLGEDFKYLSEDEQVSSHKLYSDLTESLEDDEESTNPELAYLAVIRQIRDSETDFFDKIKCLPIKAKSGKYSNAIENNATITFLRKGYLKTFYKTEGEVTEGLTFMKAIGYIKAERDTKTIKVEKDYYKHLNKNKQAFDDKLFEEIEVVADKVSVTGNDAKIIKILKALARCKKFTDEQDKLIAKMITMWENGEMPQALTKQILKDIKEINNELQAFYEIFDRIPDRYFAGRAEKKTSSEAVRQVILSCFMWNGGIADGC
ncbi:MAG TPA: helicase-related protein [Desulfosporosinus sp.]|nr:helicase-related protein [Desulfosporosinus sp.]